MLWGQAILHFQLDSYILQRFQHHRKSWKSGKWQNHFLDLGKSWNLKNQNHWKNHGLLNTKNNIMEFCFGVLMFYSNISVLYAYSSVVPSIWCIEKCTISLENSWKNHGISLRDFAGNPHSYRVVQYNILWRVSLEGSPFHFPPEVLKLLVSPVLPVMSSSDVYCWSKCPGEL